MDLILSHKHHSDNYPLSSFCSIIFYFCSNMSIITSENKAYKKTNPQILWTKPPYYNPAPVPSYHEPSTQNFIKKSIILYFPYFLFSPLLNLVGVFNLTLPRRLSSNKQLPFFSKLNHQNSYLWYSNCSIQCTWLFSPGTIQLLEQHTALVFLPFDYLLFVFLHFLTFSRIIVLLKHNSHIHKCTYFRGLCIFRALQTSQQCYWEYFH